MLQCLPTDQRHRHLVICFHFSESVIIITVLNFHNKITQIMKMVSASFLTFTLAKTKMTIDKRLFEDVSSPIHTGDCSLVGGYHPASSYSTISGTSHCAYS